MAKKYYRFVSFMFIILIILLFPTIICKADTIAMTKDLTTELFKKPFHRNLKIYTPFRIGNENITFGDFDLEQSTNIKFIKNSRESLKITVKPTNSTSHRIEFGFGNPNNLYKKNFGLWYYLPKDSMITSQRAKFNTFAFCL